MVSASNTQITVKHDCWAAPEGAENQQRLRCWRGGGTALPALGSASQHFLRKGDSGHKAEPCKQMGPGRGWAAVSCSPRHARRQYQACRRRPAQQQVACQRHSSVPRRAATGPGRVGLVFFQELLQPQPDHNLDSVGLATLCLRSAGQTVAGPGQSRGRGLPEGLAAQPEAGSPLKRSPC